MEALLLLIMAVVVGMYDINCQGDIENPSLILFSEGLKKKKKGWVVYPGHLHFKSVRHLS